MRILLAIVPIAFFAGCATEQAPGPGPAPPKETVAPAKAGRTRTVRPRAITLAEGTPLAVRTTTALSTESHKTGDVFTATLEAPLVDGDATVAAKGATVEGQIVEADKGGRVKGRAHLTVRLTHLQTADGQTVAIQTGVVSKQAPATKSEDATKIGIGSGVGAAIGAIAGGGRGAAVGAAVGAGAGTGAVVATRGAPAVVRSETVLKFALRAPLTVTAQ